MRRAYECPNCEALITVTKGEFFSDSCQCCGQTFHAKYVAKYCTSVKIEILSPLKPTSKVMNTNQKLGFAKRNYRVGTYFYCTVNGYLDVVTESSTIYEPSDKKGLMCVDSRGLESYLYFPGKGWAEPELDFVAAEMTRRAVSCLHRHTMQHNVGAYLICPLGRGVFKASGEAHVEHSDEYGIRVVDGLTGHYLHAMGKDAERINQTPHKAFPDKAKTACKNKDTFMTPWQVVKMFAVALVVVAALGFIAGKINHDLADQVKAWIK